MFLTQRNLLFICVIIYLNGKYFQVTKANSIFNFGFDLGLNVNENSFKTSFTIGDEEENVSTTTTKDTIYLTESPVAKASPILTDIWRKQAQLNATANDKLQASQVAVTGLKNEILIVVGRSDFIAAKVKLMTRYLNKVNAVTATTNTAAATATVADVDNDDGSGSGGGGSIGTGHDDAAANRFLILQDYVQLVDDLRAPPPTSDEGGERSLDYMVMKLGLEKHKLIELQTQILLEVLQAMETWQEYVKIQLMDVITV